MPLLNKSLKDRRKRTGDKTYGRPGGYRDSPQVVLSYEVAEQIAAETGLSVEHAHRFLLASGAVFQSFLLRGKAVGIPYLGCLYMGESWVRPRASFEKNGSALPMMRMRRVRLFIPRELRLLIQDSAVYTGPLRDKVKLAKERLKASLRRHTGHRKHGLKHIREGIIMDHEVKKPAKAKPGLLVEDADAIVDTAENGRQTIVKTPDRAAEAQRRGVDESKL